VAGPQRHPRAHEGVEGTAFDVWAPSARSVRVVGDFNLWDGRLNPMRSLGSSGIWELFVPGVGPGARYKYEVLTGEGHLTLKADAVAAHQWADEPPATDSVVAVAAHQWADDAWLERRDATDWLHAPVSAYEVHLGSWLRRAEDGGRPLTYRELAEELPDYVAGLGFTHVSLMPAAEHPFSGSWGYQASSYFAARRARARPTTSGFWSTPCTSAASACRSTGCRPTSPATTGPRPLRRDGPVRAPGSPPGRAAPTGAPWCSTFGRNEVRNFLVSNALYWVKEFHADGLRVDGVASMLYLDYSRKDGEWVPDQQGGRDNLEAVAFLREMNEVVYGEHPGTILVAKQVLQPADYAPHAPGIC